MPQKLIQHSLGFSRESRMDSIMRTSKTLMFSARNKNQQMSNLLEFERKRINSDEHLVLIHTNKSIADERNSLSKMLAMQRIYQRHSFEKYDPVLHPNKRNRYCHLDARDLMKMWFKGKTVSIAKSETDDTHSKTDSRPVSSIFHRLRRASGSRSRKMSCVSGEGDTRGKLLTETIHEENRSDFDSLNGAGQYDFEEVVYRLDDDYIHDRNEARDTDVINTVQAEQTSTNTDITTKADQVVCTDTEYKDKPKCDDQIETVTEKNDEYVKTTTEIPNIDANGREILIGSLTENVNGQSLTENENNQDSLTKTAEADTNTFESINRETSSILVETKLNTDTNEVFSEKTDSNIMNEVNSQTIKTNSLEEHIKENIEKEAIYISSPAMNRGVHNQEFKEGKTEGHNLDKKIEHNVENQQKNETLKTSYSNELSMEQQINNNTLDIQPEEMNTHNLPDNVNKTDNIRTDIVKNRTLSSANENDFLGVSETDKQSVTHKSPKRFVKSSTERNSKPKMERERSSLSSKTNITNKSQTNTASSNGDIKKKTTQENTKLSNKTQLVSVNTNKNEAIRGESATKTQSKNIDRLASRERKTTSSTSSQNVHSRETSRYAFKRTEQPSSRNDLSKASDAIIKHKSNAAHPTTAPGILRRAKTEHEPFLNETRRSSSASTLKFDRIHIKNAATNNPVNWKGLIHRLRGQKTETIIDDRVVEAKSTRRLKRREKTFVLSRERTIFAGECKSTWQMRKFIDREVSDLMYSLSPQGKRQNQIELLKEREMKLPGLVNTSKSTSAILRDFRKFRGNERTVTAP